MKYNYFEALDSLSLCAHEAVTAAVSGGSASDMRAKFHATLLELEGALFGEFLPPLRRESIAEYAHSLSRLTDTACEHMALRRSRCISSKQTEEERICLELSSRIRDGTDMLKSLKRPGEIPDIKEYRALLSQAHEAHERELRGISVGSARASELISLGKLRRELSLCFDALIEIMLNNI